MRVLLCENDPSTASAIELFLSSEGIICETVNAAEEGIDRVKLMDFDALIIDVLLDGALSGCDIILRLRAAKIKVPIMIISGLSSTDHKIKGLGFGADDYLAKPFKRGELLARLQAIIRRAKGHSESVIRFGPRNKGRINIDSRTVYVEGYGNINLTSKEYSILELLALRKGCVISKEAFLNHLYGGYEEPHVKIVDVFCCKTRKKLNQAFIYSKKAEIKYYKKLFESGNIKEVPEFKNKSASEIKERIEYLENIDVENSISTLWGRGYVLRDFDDKKDKKYFSNDNNYLEYDASNKEDNSDDSYGFFADDSEDDFSNELINDSTAFAKNNGDNFNKNDQDLFFNKEEKKKNYSSKFFDTKLTDRKVDVTEEEEADN